DHYAGGAGIAQPDGSVAYAHANCSWTTMPACPTNQIGEVNYNIKAKLPASSPTFSVHRDSAPAFWVNGQPDRPDPTLRKLERDVAALQAIDPYVSSSPTAVFLKMVDTIGEKALHMVNTDTARTPSFTAFGNPDYFVTDANPSCGSNPCIDYHFAWSHGDIQQEIASNWLGLVGQGGTDRLTASTHALNSASTLSDSRYTSLENSIQHLTSQRDALAAHIRSALNAAAFDGQAINEQQAKAWIAQAQSLIEQARALAAS